jgi:cytochrome P450
VRPVVTELVTAEAAGVGDLDARLEELFASRPEALADPWPLWEELRTVGPVHRVGPRVLVSRYEDVKPILRTSELFSNGWATSGSQAQEIVSRLSEEQRIAHLALAEFESKYVSRSDGEAHARLRGIAHRAFTPRRIADLTASIQRYTDELLDAMAEEPVADFIAGLSYQLPLMVIADMLGVPASDRELIHDWSARVGSNRAGTNPEVLLDAHEAMLEFRSYVDEIIAAHRRGGSSSGLVAALLDASEGDRLADDELAAMFVVLLFAGHETTTNLLGTGLFELLRHPDQWALLREDSELVSSAVEELLRWVAPIQWLARVVTQDTELGGERIYEGETVVAVLACANRDPSVFDRPRQLDLTRSDSREHLSLGFGPHFCLGASLTRLEGTVVFEALRSRFPDLALAGDTFDWRGSSMFRGLSSLPVALGAARGVG